MRPFPAVVVLGACVAAPEGEQPMFAGGAGLHAAAPPVPLFDLGWVSDGDEDGALFGSSVAPAGDVNGDAWPDLIIGAPGAGIPATFDEDDNGEAYAFHGSPFGPGIDRVWTATVTAVEDAWFGATVRPAGDVNGDGFADVAVSVARDDFLDDLYDKGTVHVFHGSVTGLGAEAAWISAETDQDPLGPAIAAGDVNGDGFGDLLVAGLTELRLYTGSATGLTGPLWTSSYAEIQDSYGLAAQPNLDHALALVDVDGEGHVDIVAGSIGFDAAEPGRLFVYPWVGPLWETVPTTMIVDTVPGRWFGRSLAAGDVNADGYGDVVLGTQHEDTDGDAQLEGGALLYLGSSTGLAQAFWTASPPGAVYQLGESVACGDVNDDGFDDVVVGSGGSTYEQIVGRVFVYLGYPGGLASTPAWKAAGTELSSSFGSAAAFVDVNGDGFDDVVVGAPTEKHGEPEEGRIYAYLGAAVPDGDGDGVPDVQDLCEGDDASGDADVDGWCVLAADGATEDCNDSSDMTYPGAAEVCDGVDSACAGLPADEADADADGASVCNGDCLDSDDTVGPFAEELCGNGVDDDCNVGTDDSCPPAQPIPPDDNDDDESGCGCATPPTGAGAWLGVWLAVLLARRRSA